MADATTWQLVSSPASSRVSSPRVSSPRVSSPRVSSPTTDRADAQSVVDDSGHGLQQSGGIVIGDGEANDDQHTVAGGFLDADTEQQHHTRVGLAQKGLLWMFAPVVVMAVVAMAWMIKPPIDCRLADAWTPHPTGCSAICGGGLITDTRAVQVPSLYGGGCPAEDSPERLRQSACNTDPCALVLAGVEGALTAAHLANKFTSAALDTVRDAKRAFQKYLPQLDCSAGGTDAHSSYADTCKKHNEIAEQQVVLSKAFEMAFDDCGLAGARFSALARRLENDLPWLAKQSCEADLEAASMTINNLKAEVSRTTQAVDACRRSFAVCSTESSAIQSGLSGHGMNIKLRARKQAAELRSIDLGSAFLKGKLTELSDSMEHASQDLAHKEADLLAAKQAMSSLQEHQLSLLLRRREAASNADSEASSADQVAKNLDASMKGKSQDQEQVDDAYKHAREVQEKARAARSQHRRAVDEYNKATSAQQSLIQADTEQLRSALQDHIMAASAKVAAEMGIEAKVQRLHHVLHDIDVTQAVGGLSANVDTSELDLFSGKFLQRLRDLFVDLEQWEDNLKAMQQQADRQPAAAALCDRAKQSIGSIVKSAKTILTVK